MHPTETETFENCISENGRNAVYKGIVEKYMAREV